MTENVYLGGTETVTSALHNVLANSGVKNPVTDEPFNEALLLGIGGGLGAGYILWEFEAHQSATIVMGFRNRWNYTVDFINNLLGRIGAEAHFVETGSAKKAAGALADACERGIPAVLWVDKAHLPHYNLPESMQGQVGHMLTVYEKTENDFLLDDLADVLYPMTDEAMAAARARITNDKHRLMTITPPENTDIETAIQAGIEDCIEHLGRSSKSFALPVYKKWSKMLTDRKNKKGWHVVFAERRSLYTTLRSVYEGITLDASDGYGLRMMYSDFLKDAAKTLDNAALEDAAGAYTATAQAWQAFANTALPDDVETFARTKTLMQTRYSAYKVGEQEKMHAAMAELDTLADDLNQNFPMDDSAVNAHFEQMQAALNAVYESEVAALDTLKNAVT